MLIHLLLLRFSSLLFVLFRLLAFGPPCRLVFVELDQEQAEPFGAQENVQLFRFGACHPVPAFVLIGRLGPAQVGFQDEVNVEVKPRDEDYSGRRGEQAGCPSRNLCPSGSY